MTIIRLAAELSKWLAVNGDVDLGKVIVSFECADEDTCERIDQAFRVDLENQTEDLVEYLYEGPRPDKPTAKGRPVKLMSLNMVIDYGQ